MSKIAFALLLMAASPLFLTQASAQTTNAYPLTILETIESTTGQLVLKSTEPIGEATFGGTTMSVMCKEDTIVSSGTKQYGIVVDLQSGQLRDRTVVDADEIDSLMQAVNYLVNINWSVTSLSRFNAGYTTRAGLRVSAFSNTRKARIEFALRGSERGLQVSPDQLSQFYNLLSQAKVKIDTLRNSEQK